MYLRNQRNKKFHDKRTLKPLKATKYSKIKNKQRKISEKDQFINYQETKLLPKEQTNEIEKYFLKQVGDVSKTSLNIVDSNKPNTSENLTNDRTKLKKSEFDLINQYLDCTRITAFNNYLSDKDLPKFNFSKPDDELKIHNVSKEFSLLDSIESEEKKDDEKFSIDYLVKQFREPFEKNKMIFLKRSQMVRKELLEVYQSNFAESPQPDAINKKNLVDCEIQTTLIYPNDQIELIKNQPDNFPNVLKNQSELKSINLEAKNFEVNSLSLFKTNDFSIQNYDSKTIKKIPFKNKVALNDLKIEDLYYD